MPPPRTFRSSSANVTPTSRGSSAPGARTAPPAIASLAQDTRLAALLRNAVEASSDDSGWSFLGIVGNNIAKQAPEFDPRNYGFKKLSELVAASGLFEIEQRKVGDGTTTSTYVRWRRSARKGKAAS